MTGQDIRLFIRLTRPVSLLVGTLLYVLGAGIARYLGTGIDWNVLFVGLLWLLMLQLSTHFLFDYFIDPQTRIRDYKSVFKAGSGALGPGKLPRPVALWGSLVFLTIAASFTVLLLQSANMSPATIAILVLLVLGVFVYTTPPMRVASSGYGELLLSIFLAIAFPAWAFLLQVGDFHRLLPMSSFPLAALFLAMVITFDLQDFAKDVKYENKTLLVRMGWRDGMILHNLLILSAYLLIILAILFGLPPAIGLPAMIPLPLAALQIWTITRISAGAKPNWRTLQLTGLTLFVATTYLFTYAFWTR